MKEIQDKALEIFRRKNTDYGESYAKFGIVGILARMEDKIMRSITIERNSVCLVEDEKLEDTIMDLYNYCALALILMNTKN